MSRIVLSTRDLVALVGDAVLTAGSTPDEYPALATVLLHTDTADVVLSSDDEEGQDALLDTAPSAVLVATSTDGFTMIGQGHAPCDGQLHRTVLINRVDAENLVKVFTALGKAAGKQTVHRTQIELRGDTIEVSEDPVVRPGGVMLTIQAQDLTDYPRGLEKALAPDPSAPYLKDGEVVPASYGSGLNPESFVVAGKVGKSRKMTPVWYRHHQLRGVVVTVGGMWRGLFRPAELEPTAYVEPQVPVFAPVLPGRKERVERTGGLDLRTASGVVLGGQSV